MPRRSSGAARAAYGAWIVLGCADARCVSRCCSGRSWCLRAGVGRVRCSVSVWMICVPALSRVLGVDAWCARGAFVRVCRAHRSRVLCACRSLVIVLVRPLRGPVLPVCRSCVSCSLLVHRMRAVLMLGCCHLCRLGVGCWNLTLRLRLSPWQTTWGHQSSQPPACVCAFAPAASGRVTEVIITSAVRP